MCAKKILLLPLCLFICLDCTGQIRDKPPNETYTIIGVPGLSEEQIRTRLECGKTAMEKWLSLNKDDQSNALVAVYLEDHTKLTFARSTEEKLIDSVRVEGNFYPRLKAWPPGWAKMQWVLRMEAWKEAEMMRERIKNLIRKPPRPSPATVNSAVLLGAIFFDVSFVVRSDNSNRVGAFDLGVRQLVRQTNRSAISIVATPNAEAFAKSLSQALNEEHHGVFVVD